MCDVRQGQLQGTLAEARVQQVVAQAEVQELALPECLTGELALIHLQGGFVGRVSYHAFRLIR